MSDYIMTGARPDDIVVDGFAIPGDMGMFSYDGDAAVRDAVVDAVKAHGGYFDGEAAAAERKTNEISDAVRRHPAFAEAGDTMVRDRIFAALRATASLV